MVIFGLFEEATVSTMAALIFISPVCWGPLVSTFIPACVTSSLLGNRCSYCSEVISHGSFNLIFTDSNIYCFSSLIDQQERNHAWDWQPSKLPRANEILDLKGELIADISLIHIAPNYILIIYPYSHWYRSHPLSNKCVCDSDEDLYRKPHLFKMQRLSEHVVLSLN